MAAGIYPILLERGADFVLQLTVVQADGQAQDLTGYSARLQVREKKNSSTFVLEMTTANGRIESTDAVNGVLTISLPASVHETAGPGGVPLPVQFRGVYDLELESGAGAVTRLIQGDFEIDAEVTK